MAASILSLGLIGMNVYQLTQHKVVPFVIAINAESGEPKILGRVADSVYSPKEQEIKYFLGQFISFVRSVPSDPVVIKKNWMNAYLYLRRQAANLLNDIANRDDDNPLKKIGEQTVSVKPISIVRVGGSNSFQARWKESRYSKNGAPIDEYTMTAVFTLEFDTPKDEATLSVNPLGIFVSNFQWNRELGK